MTRNARDLPSVAYCNPVHAGYFADPFVLRVDGGYLAYGTGSTIGGRIFEILWSPDLISWQSKGGALEPVPPSLGTTYWAPEVVYMRGRYWLYYSLGEGDEAHHIRVASADGPMGPFIDAGVNLTPNEMFAIDAHPFQDIDGTWYLYHARDVLTGERVGTHLAVDVLDSPTSMRGRSSVVLAPTDEWQLFQRDRSKYGRTYDWHTLEGPTVRRHDGRYYCFYSGGSWQGAGYAVAWAVADSPLGPWHQSTRSGRLLETVPGHVIGPGHNSVVTTPEGTDVLVYHAWDGSKERRQMCIDPLIWTPAGPHTKGPTWEPQRLPLRTLLQSNDETRSM